MLVDRAGAPVTKDALMEAAWPGLAVEDSNLTVQIAALRRALREVPGGESWIATLPVGAIGSSGPLSPRARIEYQQRQPWMPRRGQRRLRRSPYQTSHQSPCCRS